MNNYLTFDEWIEHINDGREFDFSYDKKQYSISVGQLGTGEGWYLTPWDCPESENEFKTAMNLFNEATINNIPFKEICEELEIEAIY